MDMPFIGSIVNNVIFKSCDEKNILFFPSLLKIQVAFFIRELRQTNEDLICYHLFTVVLPTFKEETL
jgi:hypothetical protein